MAVDDRDGLLRAGARPEPGLRGELGGNVQQVQVDVAVGVERVDLTAESVAVAPALAERRVHTNTDTHLGLDV